MASVIYPKFKKAVLSAAANSNLLTGSVKLILVDLGAYTYDAAHEFLSSVPAGARIGISGPLTGKGVSDAAAFTSANGRLDGITGTSVEGVLMIIDTGAEGTTRLVALYDSATGLPVTPAGASYNVLADTGGVWFTL